MAERELISTWHDGSRIGRFVEEQSAGIRFEYDPDYRGIPLSVSLPSPPTQRAPDAAAAHFLDNLLPTPTWARRILAASQLREEFDDFALLGHIGLECPGRMMLSWPRLAGSLRTHQEAFLDEEHFKHWVANPADRPLMPMNNGRTAFTLSGSRPKAILKFSSERFWRPTIPVLGASSTHLLKAPTDDDSTHEVIEEWICLQLAEKVIGKTLVTPGELWNQCLKVQRYDRRMRAGQVYRIHQEDFAQALGISAADSRADAGDADDVPSTLLARAAALIDELGRQGRIRVPALQKDRFFRQLMLRLLLGDPGLGLKKFSLIHHDNGQIELAPMYGLRCKRGRVSPDSETANQFPGNRLIVGLGRQSEDFSEQDCIDCASLQLGLSRRYAARELKQIRQNLLKLPGSLWSIQLAQRHPEAEPLIRRVLESLRERLQ